MCGVKPENYDAENFISDGSKVVDREVDFKLYDKNRREYRCEVKLMGKGNPEAADVVIARDTDVFIADTLSEQVKAQLSNRKVHWLELKGHSHEDIIAQFKKILSALDVPFS